MYVPGCDFLGPIESAKDVVCLQNTFALSFFIIKRPVCVFYLQKRGMLYGTDLISPNSIFDYLYTCVSHSYSVWLYI